MKKNIYSEGTYVLMHVNRPDTMYTVYSLTNTIHLEIIAHYIDTPTHLVQTIVVCTIGKVGSILVLLVTVTPAIVGVLYWTAKSNYTMMQSLFIVDVFERKERNVHSQYVTRYFDI